MERFFAWSGSSLLGGREREERRFGGAVKGVGLRKEKGRRGGVWGNH